MTLHLLRLPHLLDFLTQLVDFLLALYAGNLEIVVLLKQAFELFFEYGGSRSVEVELVHLLHISFKQVYLLNLGAGLGW